MDLNENTDIVDDLFYNSINIMALIVGIEQEFRIEIPDDHLLFDNLRKYSALKEMVISLVVDKEGKACENS